MVALRGQHLDQLHASWDGTGFALWALDGEEVRGTLALRSLATMAFGYGGLALLGTSARPETAEIRALREAAIGLFAAGRAAEVLRANRAMQAVFNNSDCKVQSWINEDTYSYRMTFK